LQAACLLNQAAGRRPMWRIRNVNSHSLRVVAVDPQTRRKQTTVVIPRNTLLPVSAKRIFTTSKDSQRSVRVQIVEGEGSSPEACITIGRCVVRDLPADLPAQTPVEVRFHYKENGRLQVRMRVTGTGQDLPYEFSREHALTDDQLDAWRMRISGLPAPARASPDESEVTKSLPLGVPPA
jgi:molecular chaperone DnaK (HSP70)